MTKPKKMGRPTSYTPELAATDSGGLPVPLGVES